METRPGPRSAAAREYRASLRRTYEHGRARIEPIAGPHGGWTLHFVPWGTRQGFTTTHRRLSSARAWAAHYERVSVRRANRVRHGLFAVLLTIVALVLLLLLTQSLAYWGIVIFIVAAVIWFIGLHELADLLDAVVPDEASDTVDQRTAAVDVWIERAVLGLEPWMDLTVKPSHGTAVEAPDARGGVA